MSDGFDEIAAGNADLAGLDAPGMLEFFTPDGVTTISRAEYAMWVRDLFEFLVSRREPWRNAINEFASQPLVVVISVVADTYRLLSDYALEHGSSLDAARWFATLRDMAFFVTTRNAGLQMSGGK